MLKPIPCMLTILLGMGLSGCADRKPPVADAATYLSDLRKDWVQQKDTMMKIAEAMPEDKFDYKPTAAQRTYGEQIMHVAVSNVELMKRSLDSTVAPPAFAEAPKTKAQILAALSEAYDYGSGVLAEQTPASLAEVRDSQYFGSATRARIVWSLLSHAMDIYGQMAVYLRLNGIVPPASRGI
jgi:uncharacterized damage-inducible protein DinB